jgi:hypothetical protein
VRCLGWRRWGVAGSGACVHRVTCSVHTPVVGVCVFVVCVVGRTPGNPWQGSETAITSCGGAAGLIMISLFQSDTAYTKGICATALLNLMTKPQCREQLIREDFVWVLVKVRVRAARGRLYACGACGLSVSQNVWFCGVWGALGLHAQGTVPCDALLRAYGVVPSDMPLLVVPYVPPPPASLPRSWPPRRTATTAPGRCAHGRCAVSLIPPRAA